MLVCVYYIRECSLLTEQWKWFYRICFEEDVWMHWWQVFGGVMHTRLITSTLRLLGGHWFFFFSLTNSFLHTLCKHAIHVTIKIEKFLFSPSFVVGWQFGGRLPQIQSCTLRDTPMNQTLYTRGKKKTADFLLFIAQFFTLYWTGCTEPENVMLIACWEETFLCNVL